MLLVAAISVSAQEKKIKVVSTNYSSIGLTFEQALGKDKYEIDSLVIEGDLDQLKAEVFVTLRDCCAKGRLTGIDLSRCASVENDEIPAMAFLPEMVNGMPRKESGTDTEKNYRTFLRYITLPNSIKRIGESAFALTNIEAVEIPARASIGSNAFNGCKYLKDVIIRGRNVRPSSEGCAFNGLADNAVLHVAPGNSHGYNGVKEWGAFATVDETENAYRVMAIDVDGSRTLAEALGVNNMRVDSMRLSGTLTADDFKCLVNNNNFGRLWGLDLSDCATEEGNLSGCWFEYLRMPKRMPKIYLAFFDFTKVEHLTLPESYDEICSGAFGNYKWFADSTITVAEGCRRIGFKAFVNCYCIKTIVLPSTLEELEPAALGFTWGKEWLEPEVDLYVNRMYPPYCSDTFNGVDMGIDGPFGCNRGHKGSNACLTRKWRLFVPVGAKKNYENAVHWDHFNTIIETPLLTGITDGIDAAVSTVADNGTTEVYTLDGRLVFKGAAQPALGKGLYIVKSGGEARKVLVK